MVTHIDRAICSKYFVEDFKNVHFSSVVVKGRIVVSNMEGFSSFSGILFAILVYYFEVGDASFGIVVGYTALVNCTGDGILSLGHIRMDLRVLVPLKMSCTLVC